MHIFKINHPAPTYITSTYATCYRCISYAYEAGIEVVFFILMYNIILNIIKLE